MRTVRVGPADKVNRSSRYFDTIEDVFGWAEHSEEVARQRINSITETMIKGGVDLKNFGGKNAANVAKSFEAGKRYAYEDMARAIQEISPERRLMDDAFDSDKICVTCGSELPRPMIPAPPPMCEWRYDANEPCNLEATHKLAVAGKEDVFACDDHTLPLIKEQDGTVKVETLP